MAVAQKKQKAKIQVPFYYEEELTRKLSDLAKKETRSFAQQARQLVQEAISARSKQVA